MPYSSGKKLREAIYNKLDSLEDGQVTTFTVGPHQSPVQLVKLIAYQSSYPETMKHKQFACKTRAKDKGDSIELHIDVWRTK